MNLPSKVDLQNKVPFFVQLFLLLTSSDLKCHVVILKVRLASGASLDTLQQIVTITMERYASISIIMNVRKNKRNCGNFLSKLNDLKCSIGEVKWYQSFKTNLSGVLTDTALTTAFGYKNNTYLLRSKYKVSLHLQLKHDGEKTYETINKLILFSKHSAYVTAPTDTL